MVWTLELGMPRMIRPGLRPVPGGQDLDIRRGPGDLGWVPKEITMSPLNWIALSLALTLVGSVTEAGKVRDARRGRRRDRRCRRRCEGQRLLGGLRRGARRSDDSGQVPLPHHPRRQDIDLRRGLRGCLGRRDRCQGQPVPWRTSAAAMSARSPPTARSRSSSAKGCRTPSASSSTTRAHCGSPTAAARRSRK